MTNLSLGGPTPFFGESVRFYPDKTDTTVFEVAVVKDTTFNAAGDLFADLVVFDGAGPDGYGSSYHARVPYDGPTVTATKVWISADQAPL